MTAIRSLLALSVAAVIAASGSAAGGAQDRGADACTTREGTVLAYVPSAGHSCPGVIAFGLTFFRSETVNAGNPGQLTFHTNHLDKCIEFRAAAGTADVLFPVTGIAIRHVRGKTWCRHLPTDRYKTLLAPGAVIHTSGTIFGLDSSKAGTLVKVSDGAVVAQSTATRKTVTVKAGFQSFIPTAGSPQQPTALKPDAQDQEGDFFLRFGILSMGAAQPPAYLEQQHEQSVVVVGPDAAALKAEAPFLRGTKTQTLTADQVAADPEAVFVRARELGTSTVLAVGDFATMEPTLKAISAVIQSKLTLVYASDNS